MVHEQGRVAYPFWQFHFLDLLPSPKKRKYEIDPRFVHGPGLKILKLNRSQNLTNIIFEEKEMTQLNCRVNTFGGVAFLKFGQSLSDET